MIGRPNIGYDRRVPRLTVIMPVYNEARTLAAAMDALVAACPDAQRVYVDDGSTDGSLAILRAKALPGDTVLAKPNGGKGSAVRTGLAEAAGAFTIVQDADLEYAPEQIALLADEAEAHPGAAVFGSRFMRDNPTSHARYLMGNKAVTAALNLLFGARVTDSYTCYKLLPTDLFRSLALESDGFELEAEICAKCLKAGVEIREIPISYAPRTVEEGKKIRFADAWKAVRTMWRIRYARAA